jgi:hypothetical protein
MLCYESESVVGWVWAPVYPSTMAVSVCVCVCVSLSHEAIGYGVGRAIFGHVKERIGGVRRNWHHGHRPVRRRMRKGCSERCAKWCQEKSEP